MNTKLIFQLSLFGLAMGIATVFWIPSKIEPFFWLGIFVLCAYLVARNASGKYFLHGFLVSVVNSVWITLAHIVLFESYVAHHPVEAEMTKGMPRSPQLMMLIRGPTIGIVSGLVLGLFALVASKIRKKSAEKVEEP